MAPKFVKLDFPPGVVRRGTPYKSWGRWFSTQLVRWYEDAMQAVGGWQVLPRTAGADVGAAISDNGGVFTDETADANVVAGTVVLIPATPVVNDAFYIGFDYRFEAVVIDVATAGAGNVVAWEYWDGSAWAALDDVDDESVSFTEVAGSYEVVWTLPSDWAKNTINTQGPFYYVRARVTTAGSTTAVGNTVDIASGPVDVDEVIRGMHSWRTNAQGPRLALGTPTRLFIVGQGTLDDVSPADLDAGAADAVQVSAAYNNGAYGVGAYGVGDDAQDTLTAATTWQLDNYGEDLLAVSTTDERILQWDASAEGLAAVFVNAPAARAVMVTPEPFVVALACEPIGGEGAIDPRLVRWADQDVITNWTPAGDNSSGDQRLATDGEILAGRRSRGESLIWTTTSLHSMQYVGGLAIYAFRELGSNCGAASRNSMAVFDGRAVWMGTRNFWLYDGFVQPIKSEVGEFVFSSLNLTHISKVHAEVRSAFGEVWFFYPSGSSTECDKYVVYNYRDGYMYIGDLARTAGVDQGVFPTPLSASPEGIVYQHEAGTSYPTPTGALVPFAESGPMDLLEGDVVTDITGVITDENTLGGVEISVLTAFSPTGEETTHGPFTPGNITDFRAAGRQIRFRLDQAEPGWRFGVLRAEAQPAGRR